MSSDDEALVVGRIVAEHREVKRSYALLRSESERIGKAISSIGSSLQYGHPVDDRAAALLEVLNVEKVMELSRELRSTYTRLQELQEKLAALGLTPAPEK